MKVMRALPVTIQARRDWCTVSVFQRMAGGSFYVRWCDRGGRKREAVVRGSRDSGELREFAETLAALLTSAKPMPAWSLPHPSARISPTALELARSVPPRLDLSYREVGLNVYFVQAEWTLHVKVGVADNVRARVAQLQVGSPGPLRLIVSLRDRGFTIEREIHRHLQDDRHRGEWFNFSPAVEGVISLALRDPRAERGLPLLSTKEEVE